MEKNKFGVNNKHNGFCGDVQYYSIDKLPEGAKKVEPRPVAFGEKTGHIHINTGDCELFQDAEGNYFVAVGKDGAFAQHIHQSKLSPQTYITNAPLEKADHKPQRLQPNTFYFVPIHRRKKHFSRVFERLMD